MNLADEMDHVEEMDKRLLWLKISRENLEHLTWQTTKFYLGSVLIPPFFCCHWLGVHLPRRNTQDNPTWWQWRGVKQPLLVSMVQLDCFRTKTCWMIRFPMLGSTIPKWCRTDLTTYDKNIRIIWIGIEDTYLLFVIVWYMILYPFCSWCNLPVRSHLIVKKSVKLSTEALVTGWFLFQHRTIVWNPKLNEQCGYQYPK